MRYNSSGLYGSAILALPILFAGAASATVIGSFDGSRSARPLNGPNYTNLVTDLENPANFGPGGIAPNSITFSAPIATATAAALAGDNVFFLTEVNSPGLTAPEITVLKNFVLAGGELVLVTNSGQPATNGVSQMLTALDGGSASGIGGLNGQNAGSIVGSGSATIGPFGNLVGGSFAVTPGSPITPGADEVTLVTGGGIDYITEIAADALGPVSGAVLAAADVSFQNFFIPPATLFPNDNNLFLIENFLAAPVPEPSTLALLGVGILGLFSMSVGRRRRLS